VADLKQEELELYVNGRPVDIYRMFAADFSDSGAQDPTTTKPRADQVRTAREPRLIFLIIDAMFNSNAGLKYSRQVARQLVAEASPEDKFLLLQIEFGGLKYVAGPEPGGSNIDPFLKNIKKNAAKIRSWQPGEDQSMRDQKENKNTMYSGANQQTYLFGNKEAQKISVLMYMDAFKQLKRALRTIDGPKLTFLLTQGFQGHVEGSRYSYDKIVTEMVNHVYDGGSVLQTVGTAHFRPQTLNSVAKRMSRTTSAYYEAFFQPSGLIGEDMTVEVKCKRPGVRIDAAGHKEKENPYQKMKTTGKKLFAVSVVTGLSFNRMLGRVRTVPVKTVKTVKIAGERRVSARIEIPGYMRNRALDVYLLRFDQNFKDVDVDLKTVTVGDSYEFSLQTEKKKQQLYVVLVEPGTTQTVFNRVK